MDQHFSQDALDARMRSVVAALCSEERRHEYGEPALRVLPFVTISRQAGAGGTSLAERLVQRLNAVEPDSRRPWSSWDRELVERIAADQRVSQDLVDSLEESHHTWLEEFLAGLGGVEGGTPTDDLLVYHRVAAAVRALATAGHVVLVGRGGVCITRNMPSGTHIRLVAPLKHRIEHMRQKLGVSQEKAAAHVREVDRNREAFYRRFWPNHPLMAEMFTVTLNTADLTEDQLVECLLPLIAPHGKWRRG